MELPKDRQLKALAGEITFYDLLAGYLPDPQRYVSENLPKNYITVTREDLYEYLRNRVNVAEKILHRAVANAASHDVAAMAKRGNRYAVFWTVRGNPTEVHEYENLVDAVVEYVFQSIYM